MPRLTKPEIGALLLANVQLTDANFKRGVILICDYNEQGTFGLLLNRPLELTISEAIEELDDLNSQIFLGGPVQPNTIHVLHLLGERIDGSMEVANGVYWGGDFEQIKMMLQLGDVEAKDFRFFLGYSGWGNGQLEEEIDGNSWYIAESNEHLIFHESPEKLWSRAVRSLGSDYAVLANFPEDPRLN